MFTFQYGFHVAKTETERHTKATVMSAAWLQLNNIPGIKAFHCSLTVLMSGHDFPFNLTDDKRPSPEHWSCMSSDTELQSGLDND